MPPAVGTPPWHVWGQSANLSRHSPAGVARPETVSQQLINAQYMRPETWTFLFFADAPLVDAGGFDPTLLVHWDLTLGLGLTTVTIPDFAVFRWNLETTSGIRWTTETQTPQNDPVSPPPVGQFQGRVNKFPAQTIQLNCRVVADQVAVAYDWNLRLYACVAPHTHIRPEWFGTPAGTRTPGNVIPNFPGNENTGR